MIPQQQLPSTHKQIPVLQSLEGPVIVVDIGPGTGRGTLDAVREIDRQVKVDSVVLVDVLPEMLTRAEAHFDAELAPFRRHCVVANLLDDTFELRNALDREEQARIVTVFGYTAGNFRQSVSFYASKTC